MEDKNIEVIIQSLIDTKTKGYTVHKNMYALINCCEDINSYVYSLQESRKEHIKTLIEIHYRFMKNIPVLYDNTERKKIARNFSEEISLFLGRVCNFSPVAKITNEFVLTKYLLHGTIDKKNSAGEYSEVMVDINTFMDFLLEGKKTYCEVVPEKLTDTLGGLNHLVSSIRLCREDISTVYNALPRMIRRSGMDVQAREDAVYNILHITLDKLQLLQYLPDSQRNKIVKGMSSFLVSGEFCHIVDSKLSLLERIEIYINKKIKYDNSSKIKKLFLSSTIKF